MTDTGGGLVKALTTVQTKMKPIGKAETANVRTRDGGSYAYTYATLADIHTVVMPLLAASGLAWMTMPTLREDGTYVLVCELAHENGESRSCEMPLPQPGRVSPQELGSAITYARRYALCAVVGVTVIDEDDDATQAQEAAEQQQRQQRRPAQSKSQPKQTKQQRRPAQSIVTTALKSNAQQLRELWTDLGEQGRSASLDLPLNTWQTNLLEMLDTEKTPTTVGDLLQEIGTTLRSCSDGSESLEEISTRAELAHSS